MFAVFVFVSTRLPSCVRLLILGNLSGRPTLYNHFLFLNYGWVLFDLVLHSCDIIATAADTRRLVQRLRLC